MAELGNPNSGEFGQLPLPVSLRDDATLDNFLPLVATQPVLLALENQLQTGGEPIIYLYGPSGSGKSHLLQASCHVAQSNALYLPLAELAAYDPTDVLQGVSSADRLCLDDLQVVLGNPQWELALFELFNLARERDCKLLVTATSAPRVLRLQLEDLRSRLSWGIVFALTQGSDEEKAAILQFRATRRGMNLALGTANFIVSRAPRAMDELLRVLDQLDEASLVQQRSLSIPFVKQALGW